jgi:hypothetical protein
VLPFIDTYWTILVAIWCLTYPLFVAAFQIKLDYRLGAPWKKKFGNGFKENEFFENLGMGPPCPSGNFMKRF